MTRRYNDEFDFYDEETARYSDVATASHRFRNDEDYDEDYTGHVTRKRTSYPYQDDRNNPQTRRKSRKKSRKRTKIFVISILTTAFVFFWCGFIAGYFIFTKDEGESLPNSPVEASNISKETNGDVNTSGDGNVSAVSASVYAEPTTDYERVINRSYPIESGYIAGTGELKVIDGSNGKQMEKNAAIALEKMVSALKEDGMDIIIQSTYRTDSDQEFLYNRQIQRQGGNELKAATISAVPLTSEHQAGLAVDLSTDGTLTESFGSTQQGKWLKLHCAEYGYILRYLPENAEYTGIISEPWHFRYVGSPDVAQDIMKSGKSMEEYYGKFLKQEDIEPYLPYLQ